MNISFPLKLMEDGRRSCKMSLILCWLIGIWSGVLVAAGADDIVSLMRACCYASVSIVGLLFIPLFPFLISAVAVYFSLPRLLCFTAFMKSFFFGFCTCVVFKGFGTAGWLVWPMLQFTDLLTLPVLCRFQLRHFGVRSTGFCRDGIAATLWFLAVAAADWLWVAPLLRDII